MECQPSPVLLPLLFFLKRHIGMGPKNGMAGWQGAPFCVGLQY